MIRHHTILEDRKFLESGLIAPQVFRRRNQATGSLVDRIGLEFTLEGHQGCVNCLQWNQDGSILASGSDDCCVILWNPHTYKNLLTLATGHAGNIFSVKFLQKRFLATGAADAKVRVHDIEKKETVHVFGCHFGRVKRLETIESEPFVFLSAAEDGAVRQFDIRCPHNCDTTSSPNVLVDLTSHAGSHAEAKCLAVNQMCPSMLAVGANDAFIRVYDRRMLSLRSVQATQIRHGYNPSETETQQPYQLPLKSTRYYIPGHILRKDPSHPNGLRSISTTYLQFSPDGSDLLANLGGDHIYIFSTTGRRSAFNCPVSPDVPDALWSSGPSKLSCSAPLKVPKCVHSAGETTLQVSPEMNRQLESEAVRASRLVEAKAFCAAVRAYNAAIARWPRAAKLFTGRAAALIKRSWDGDIYAALRDCLTALDIVSDTTEVGDTGVAAPPFSKSECLQITAQLLATRCLLRLCWVNAARQILEFLRERYIRPFADGAETVAESASLAAPKNGASGLVPGASAAHNLRLLYRLLDTETRKLEANCIRKTQASSTPLSNDVEAKESPSKARTPRSLTSGDGNDLGEGLHELSSPSPRTTSSSIIRECLAVSAHSPTSSPDNSHEGRETDGEEEKEEDDYPHHTWDQSPSTASTSSSSSMTARASTHLTSPDRKEAEEESLESVRASGHSARQDNCPCVECSTLKFAQAIPLKSTHFFERTWREEAVDYEARFLGHCNVTTDIKEANFFGGDGQFIVAGSDCGSMFIWDRQTTNIVHILQADSATVNCVQPHPSLCQIASSGIDNVIRLWSPLPEDKPECDRLVKDHVGAAEANQERLRADPLEVVLRHIGYGMPRQREGDRDASTSLMMGGESSGDASSDASSDSHYSSLPVCPGGGLTDTHSGDPGDKESQQQQQAAAPFLDPPVAASALEESQADDAAAQRSRERSISATARSVMAHIVVGLPGERGRSGGAVIFQTRRRRQPRRRTESGEEAGSDNDRHFEEGGENTESGGSDTESGAVLDLPCTTS
uniref:26S proteasome non-ATPase regulatory subunit 7 n=2 Tax=Schistocephalus solidus TaxID=70667 RepID=A0A0X3NX51_SCHSO